MGLNPALLSQTFKRIQIENGGASVFGLRFYERLFDKYPTVRPLFHASPEEQHKKLIASIGAIVATVSQPEKLLPYLHAMGIRHLKYKTDNSHYAAVGENLIAVLKEHLSKEGEWSDGMESSWKEALEVVSSIMIEAANSPENFREELLHAGYKADGFKEQNNEPWLLDV